MKEPSALRDADAVARVLERAAAWVAAETPSGDVARGRVLAERIAAELGATGASVEPVDAPAWGRHLVARLPGDGRRPLLLLGHYDTVHPAGTIDRLPFRIDAGRAYGPGIFDMKASLALAVEALDSATRARPVIALFTCDEEVGSPSSRPLVESLARESDAVFVLEPPLPGGGAKTQRKGVAVFTVTTRGRAAHAGIEPEAGIDAIVEIAHQIGAVHALADAALGTTVTVGRVAGGTASNVVPDHAEADVDVRFATPEEGERVEGALRALRPRDPRVRLTVEGGINRPPLVRTDAVAALYRHAREQARIAGFELAEGSTGGGSDGCFAAAVGTATLDGLGVPGAGAHTLDEHILVDELAPRLRFLRALIETT